METGSPGCRKAAHIPPHSLPPPPVPLLSSVTEATDTNSSTGGAAAAGGGPEDDKDRIVVEIIQMYSRQQEKLNSTLHKQLQLEMVRACPHTGPPHNGVCRCWGGSHIHYRLPEQPQKDSPGMFGGTRGRVLNGSLCLQELEALRGGEAARLRELSAEQRELRSELEAVHSEQTRQLSQARQEQLELETRLEQLRQQACACEPGAQRQQEAHYAAQVRSGARTAHGRTVSCI